MGQNEGGGQYRLKDGRPTKHNHLKNSMKNAASEAAINTLGRQSQYTLKIHDVLFICALSFGSG